MTDEEIQTAANNTPWLAHGDACPRGSKSLDKNCNCTVLRVLQRKAKKA